MTPQELRERDERLARALAATGNALSMALAAKDSTHPSALADAIMAAYTDRLTQGDLTDCTERELLEIQAHLLTTLSQILVEHVLFGLSLLSLAEELSGRKVDALLRYLSIDVPSQLRKAA